jgi:hypothetical protein
MTRRRNVTEQAATAAIEQGCRMLRLPTIRDRFAEIAAAAEREQLSYLGFLSELVIAECDDRTRRRAERRIRGAGFPRPKRLEEFSFEANPAIKPAVIGQLASCAWVKAGHPLCLTGDRRRQTCHSAALVFQVLARQTRSPPSSPCPRGGGHSPTHGSTLRLSTG